MWTSIRYLFCLELKYISIKYVKKKKNTHQKTN